MPEDVPPVAVIDSNPQANDLGRVALLSGSGKSIDAQGLSRATAGVFSTSGRLSWRHALSLRTALVVLAAVAVVTFALVVSLCAQYSMAAVVVGEPSAMGARQALVLQFSRPVSPAVTYRIEEGVKGDWRVNRRLGLVTSLEFTPAAALDPGTVLHVRLGRIVPVPDLGSGTHASQTVLARVLGTKEPVTPQAQVSTPLSMLSSPASSPAAPSPSPVAPQTKKLAIPLYVQAYRLSCEEASLRMALAYRGIAVTDDDVLARVGYNPTVRDTATNTWADPRVQFVGDVTGHIGVGGWGVYAGPIAAAARSFGRGVVVVSGGATARQVAQALSDDKPVIAWGISGAVVEEDSWNTPSGDVVRAPKNEHVRTVYGFDGTVENPIGFYINDPMAGRGKLYWSASEFQANLNAGGGYIVIVE